MLRTQLLTVGDVGANQYHSGLTQNKKIHIFLAGIKKVAPLGGFLKK